MTMALIHDPAYGLAVYDTTLPAYDPGPLANPTAYPNVVKFHSALQYPAIKTTATYSASLPALTGTVSNGWLVGNYHSGRITLGQHGQADVPIIKAMLIGFDGADRPLQGTFITDVGAGSTEAARFFRCIDIGISGADVILTWRAIVGANVGASTQAYAARSLSIKVWVFDWTISGSPTLYDPNKPLLELSSSRVQVGRGMFDTSRSYVRSDTGSENTILTQGATTFVNGTETNAAAPTWGWRQSVDGHTKQGQLGGSDVAAFERIELP